MSVGPARKGFDGDLFDGKLAEDSFARFLLEGREKWEHKRDFAFARTGNVAIEYETSEYANGGGQKWPSGIATCEAHWWVIEYLPSRRILWPTDEIKELARRAVRAGHHRWIGDNNRFHNALVPGGWFMEHEAPALEAAA